MLASPALSKDGSQCDLAADADDSLLEAISRNRHHMGSFQPTHWRPSSSVLSLLLRLNGRAVLLPCRFVIPSRLLVLRRKQLWPVVGITRLRACCSASVDRLLAQRATLEIHQIFPFG